jgi:signal transduction histidine kinase
MRFYEKTLFLRLAFTLAIIFISIIIMVAWWQMLFHKNLDYYVLSEKKILETRIVSALYKQNNDIQNLLKENKIIFTQKCQGDICVPDINKNGFYEIHPEYDKLINKEKNRKFRMFLSETSFLIIIILFTIGYMVWVISREKKIQIEKQEFLTMTTHELKHPVSVISLLLESLSRGSLPENRINEFLQKGMNEVKTLKKSLDNILKLQELSSSARKPVTPYNVNIFLSDLVQNWQMHELNRENRIIFEKIHELEIMTQTNISDLQTILNNLIENALLYSKDKVIITNGHDNHGDYISVRDSGLGFSGEDIKNYQKMFFRSTRHDIQNIRGSGLGHFIIKKLLVKNSLQLTLESEGENKGSLFRLYIR